jgi:DNA-binding XRE family transcriptional regulator
VSRWRDSGHLERAVETAGGQEAFDAAVGAMMDDARGWRLAEMRKRRGLTQERVATRMGVSVARVSQIESGDVSTQDVLNRFVALSAVPSSSSPTSVTSSSRSPEHWLTEAPSGKARRKSSPGDLTAGPALLAGSRKYPAIGQSAASFGKDVVWIPPRAANVLHTQRMEDPFDSQTLWVLQPGHVPANHAKYQIFDGERQLLAVAAETGRRSRINLISKAIPDTNVLAINTGGGEPLLTMIRQHTEWMTELRNPAGEVIGRIRTGSTRRHYTLLDETDQTVAKVVGDLGLKNFAVSDTSGGKVAMVRKMRAGLFKEMLTSNDHYKVEFIGPVPQFTRTLVAMVPIVLDLTLYEPL